MSSKDNPCRKFQANIFNKSKCQNCFKPRESHLLNDEDLNQAKPIYGGWLLLAPEGTNFDNPLHRSRKWQRRFFILYEHGLLRYALDEMPSTLPQGTINMNQCSDVIDGESRTGQKSSLCILTSDKEHFIRAECKEIINGWQEALTVYPRTNKQNQKKKRKVEPPTPQEPGPAKVTVTSSSSGVGIPCLPSSIASAERVPASRASLWQEEGRWSRATIPCSRSASCISQLAQSHPGSSATTQDDGGTVNIGRKVRVESGYFSLEKTKSEPAAQPAQTPQPPQHLSLSTSASSSSLGAPNHRRSQVIERFEDGQSVEQMDTSVPAEPPPNTVSIQRQSRSERRYLSNKPEFSLDAGKERSVPDVSSSTLSSFRRAKSLDRRVTESSMTPDLLNFKKGWMTKLYEDGMWKKHWFVLTDQSLRYYKDSIAEEASDLDGEIDLSTCYDVTEFPVQRNYGFQILSKEGAWTLSAMTSGIRRNWIQAIMKNVRPTIAPDVTRSLPEEKAKARVVLERCPQPSPEPAPSPEALRVEVHVQRTGSSAPASEPRKGRVRERRREGRSKTYDWSEFKAGQMEKPKRDRADTVDLSSPSSSTTTTTTTSSSSGSSTSSPASSPISAASSPQTSSSVSAPPPPSIASPEEAENEQGHRREERRHILQQTPTNATHASNTVTVTLSTTLNASPGVQSRIPEPQDQGRMEVDHPAAMHPDPSAEGSGQKGDRTPDVQVEIEQRWHQVETTPLREEKQVPIASTAGNSSSSDRLPPHELAAILDKELGQKQKELVRLQEENNLLQEQLEDARGREHSARDGYVLQSATPPSSSPHRVPWQRLHKLNQDLQGELEAQKRKQDHAQQQVQTLRRSFTEAQDTVGRHEAEVQALQAKLTAAMAEILASEQAVARMRNELKLEQGRSREQEEEWGCSEVTLRTQLRDSEDRLREVEASLLERNQALRHLERQQALQRDHLREIQRLQERLQEVTARLSATEDGQALKEERLRNEQQCMQESHERERQSLSQRLAEAEAGRMEMEGRLLEAEQLVEALLRGRRASGGMESREELLRLQEELSQRADMVETLRESVRRLEEEKGHLTCRCQELINQIAEADREVNKLRSRLETEEADYYTLEHSYEKASEEFQRMSQFLREKEEEIRQTKEMYERLVERKEEDLKEALVKMAALGNSLEETEQRLQAKEELLCQMSLGLLGQGEPCSAERDLQAKLVVAEDRIAELEQHLNALQLGYADLRMERQRVHEEALHTQEMERVERSASIPTNTESSLPSEITCKTKCSSGGEESQAKRQRIRFSSIQCQKDINPEGLDTNQVDGTSLDTSKEITPVMSQVCHPSQGTGSSDITFQYCSDPEKVISIIHALETKLLATEDKLRNLTQKLEEQRAVQPEDLSMSDLQGLDDGPSQEEVHSSGSGCQIRAANNQYAKALACVEMSREKVRAILSGYDQGSPDSQLHSLSEIEKELVNATKYIRQGEKTLEEHAPETHQNRTQEKLERKDVDQETIHLFAKTLSFEAIVLNKMALLIQNPKSDLLQGLGEICEELESIKRGDRDCLAIVYADVLTRKLMLESAFWKEVEKAETQCEMLQRESSDVAKSTEDRVLADTDAGARIVINTSIKAELTYSIENLKHFYEERFRMLKRELTEARNNLQQRELALKEIFQAFKRPDLENVIKEHRNKFDFSQRQTLADISPPELAHYVVQRLASVTPPELAPYMEQIEMEEARDMAEEIIDRHLAGDSPSCSIDSIESLQIGQENLAVELQRQAATLHRFAQEIENGSNHPGLADMICTLAGPQTSYNSRGSSLCMREALIQAQVAYVACRLRANHEQDLSRCQQACQNMDALVQEHARNVGTIRECYEASLQEERLGFTRTVTTLQEENQNLKSEVSQRVEQLSQQQQQLAHLEEHFRRETEDLRQRHTLELTQAEQSRSSTELVLMETTADSQRKLEVLLMDMDTMEERHEGHVRKLEEQFQERIRELQQIHEEEIQRLHADYMNTVRCFQEGEQDKKSPAISHSLQCDEVTAQTWPMEEEEQGKGEEVRARSEVDPMTILKDRIQELETQMNTMRDELENKNLEGDVASLREKYQRDFESLKATCERGFAAMEETHQKVIEDLQRQHQREVSKLMEERERLLAEETAATIAAIEAMKNAHKEELEKTHRSQLSGLNSDIDELRLQYEEELQSIQRELEVLSEQYSQKCLENAHLAQALEAERQALRQCQRENQELNAHNQELNNRLTAEITRMRSCYSGETALSPLTQGKDLYELEVLLRIKESEIQYLKQEIHSLKDELQSALRDKKYATDKYKHIYTELSIVKAKADCDITKLTEKLLVATEALGERTVDGTPGYDIMKSKSNPDFLKKERSTLTKQIRGVRSKSLKEGLTVQERMKLFETKDSKKI